MTRTRLLITLALPLFAAACSHAKPEVKAEPPQAEAAPATPAPEPEAKEVAAVEAKTCASDDDCQATELCVESRCRAIEAGMPECAATIHFDFDRSDLEESDRPLLQRAARCLQAIPATRAVIAGNCDERGTSQYNVALGYRRATAIEKYLEALGVPSARLQTVSYGKESPVCREASEDCWAKNRRGDISPGAR